jgi:hypothetical protein
VNVPSAARSPGLSGFWDTRGAEPRTISAYRMRGFRFVKVRAILFVVVCHSVIHTLCRNPVFIARISLAAG